ncbi:Aldo/keto reductase [Thozetella sp. PMI_491]|nr:Aldo/keto reductase [Thozetella sp. PMI_491]
MAAPPPRPEVTTIAGKVEIPRIINGLWQLAGGHDPHVDIGGAVQAMAPLIEAGLSCFDMADHYGDAELVIGEYNSNSDGGPRITAFTKWCPQENKNRSFEQAQAAVDLALARMKQKSIALMQYHAWDYTDESYLCNLAHLQAMQDQGKIDFIGLTNTDAAHLELLLHSGYRIATNQVSCSVIDLRLIKGRLSSVCAENDVGILAYGTLLGGYLSEKWLGAPEPRDEAALNWSLRKYLRFIRAAGGWGPFQEVLKALSVVSKRHGVPITAVATRWVLDVPVVKAVIVGSRLSASSNKYTADNLSAFAFSLDDEDRALILSAQQRLSDIPGDCGDEYRRPPFLTTAGDLSHHIHENSDAAKKLAEAVANGSRIEYRTSSKWEPIAGYCRAVRTGDLIRVSGTTANPPPQIIDKVPVLGGTCARCQAVASLDIIARSIKALGGTLADVVRTRIMIQNEDDCDAVSEAHGWVLGCEKVRPANTLTGAHLIGDEFLVEIEAEAVVGSGKSVYVVE